MAKVAYKTRRFYLARTWFVIDALVALAPPLYWAADSHKAMSLFGVPLSLGYFLLVSFSITASILYAYWVDADRGEAA